MITVMLFVIVLVLLGYDGPAALGMALATAAAAADLVRRLVGRPRPAAQQAGGQPGFR